MLSNVLCINVSIHLGQLRSFGLDYKASINSGYAFISTLLAAAQVILNFKIDIHFHVFGVR